ncbi:hypothetical protein ERJ75_001277700 [Trypanosoma vivax]|nr:hypothetical protein ERJ75_001277700 [Trypanosoma vivax]
MVREGSARGRTGPAAPKHGPQNGVRADARWHGALGVPGRMVDGSVIAEIVEAATRAVMQRMFDGAGQRVCGDGRRNYVSPQKASTPSFVRPIRVPSLGLPTHRARAATHKAGTTDH